MGQTTKIEWTDVTWNIAKGCTKISDGCKNCYMYRLLGRFKIDGNDIQRTKKTAFTLPLRVKKPSKIFACSITDFFHEALDDFRNEAWDIIKACPQHTFQILTKRPERIKNNLPADWGNGYPNVWLGATVESFKYTSRIFHLLKVPAAKRFISCEPLIGPVNLKNIIAEYINNLDATTGIDLIEMPEGVGGMMNYKPLDWVIIGCESGPNRRPANMDYVRVIVEQCKRAEIPVFIKQLEIDGKVTTEIDKFPYDLQIKEFPKE